MATQTFNFDEIFERQRSGSMKWNHYDSDVIPMWVADMDFASPQVVVEALQERAALADFGYAYSISGDHRPMELIEVWRERFALRYGWQVGRDDFLFAEGVVNAIHASYEVLRGKGDAILLQSPNYWHFFGASKDTGRPLNLAHMIQVRYGNTLRFEVDFDALEAAITPETGLFMFSNPHNPIGRAYERWELEKLAEMCLRHDLLICSDEIHQDLLLDGRQHIPIASLSPEVAQRCVTLTAATKTFNLAGLRLATIISQNHEMLDQLTAYYRGHGAGSANIMGVTATQAALEQGQPWLDALLRYLEGNRDFALDYIHEKMPDIIPVKNEATFLMFLDCRALPLEVDPCEFFLDQARVALSGDWRDQGCGGFARLNLGCPRSQLEQALSQMAESLRHL